MVLVINPENWIITAFWKIAAFGVIVVFKAITVLRAITIFWAFAVIWVISVPRLLYSGHVFRLVGTTLPHGTSPGPGDDVSDERRRPT